ncbi:ornithine carbamoyltransferase, catabolic [Paenibacillus larvae subsp. larvae]|uniref:Ornithine carbamoyltransferase n=1 Tax=Paenibacillus larvae subsp. larvae TaxID=147375 RepID=A0A2L1UCP6_9BACL|nr:ornithine carbamoyltransferase [Paenibacillus larvae]AQT86931.1 ornithine carbamoyltransferase [Paenibacillus larvae subsp. pulvifaciens]AQZ49181.1 ornithine carbamoyltransferase [Paenibacillus larvae subsp. pulvifaciens]AVF25922.1 ornithine carbamoyltransferase, catabolic [Paenibacillus larvae subsp. larvae]AVF30699.1 ornithine carbamoyltransferase, catabolic [Paenibacillus larvae subsp. larvae]MBH0341541.1 ornithine carbamoyltransferase [Paenibacillus larvae]
MLGKQQALKGKSFLAEKDFTEEELLYFLDLAEELKEKKKKGIPHRYLQGKNIALLFEKTSTRTRCAFTVASTDLGAHPEYLGKNDIQLGKKESIEDTAKVLGSMFDAIEFRGFEHSKVEALAKYSGVPVWNGLTDRWHPSQTLADLLTIKEHTGHLKGVKLVYVGDGRNNVANSLLIGGAIVGMEVRICSPESLFPDQEIIDMAKQYNGRIMVSSSIEEAVSEADVIYTDVWVSMGEEDKFAERVKLLKPYQVNTEMLRKTGNKDVMFLHCLPSFHDTETDYGREAYEKYGIKEMEVTDEVFRSRHSKVFEQAENRMHTIKAVMAATLGDLD